MTAPCFVDANVFVYTRDPRDGAKQARAAEWIAQLWRERSGRTSVQVLSEYYVLRGCDTQARVPRCARPDCALLLSEDLQDGAMFGGVTVRSPFTLDVREPAAAYAAVPVAASRHRGRGRPRKAVTSKSGDRPHFPRQGSAAQA